jgi:hypothetical protein
MIFIFPKELFLLFQQYNYQQKRLKYLNALQVCSGKHTERYLDLQKAEAQARQAHIETAMEKVRARALAMQKPEELIEVAQVLRKEMGLLV